MTEPSSEPTKEEIDKATIEFKEKFGKELSKEDAVSYAKLRNELGYWLTIEKEYKEKNCITEDMAKEVKDLIAKQGKEITLEQAYLEAEKSLITTIADAKERISNDIKSIINRHSR